jgi:hypothetical protein
MITGYAGSVKPGTLDQLEYSAMYISRSFIGWQGHTV